MDKAQKITITLKSSLLDRVNKYVEGGGLTRSGLIAVALTSYLDAQEALPKLNQVMAALAATFEGTISGSMSKEEAQISLDEIEAKYNDYKGKFALPSGKE